MPKIGIAAGTLAKTKIGIDTRELVAIKGVVVDTEFGIRDFFFLVLGTLCSTFENMSFWY